VVHSADSLEIQQYFPKTPIMPSTVNSARRKSIVIMACLPSSDSHLHSGSSPPPNSQHHPPPLLPLVSRPQGSQARHLMDFQIPILPISTCFALFPRPEISTYLTFPCNCLFLLRIRDIWIESCFLLFRGTIICPAFRVFYCFGVDAGSVLAVFSWKSGEWGLRE
jgi:hypothetical protein